MNTVHEMAKDEARHGVALKGLLERSFKYNIPYRAGENSRPFLLPKDGMNWHFLSHFIEMSKKV